MKNCNSVRIREFALIFTILLLVVFIGDGEASADTDVIDSADELTRAIASASDGDEILVGDIDFTPRDGMFKLFMRIEITKSLTIKSGKSGENACFKDAAFIVVGSKTSGERISVSFEGITFDGGNEVTELTAEDWEYPVNEETGEASSSELLKANFACNLRGNCDVRFDSCIFQNYMNEQGGVINAFYADYTASPELMQLLGDYTGCTASIEAENCDFTGNASNYSGGAVYLEGERKNLTFSAKNCRFTGNITGRNDFSRGGGAICTSDAILKIEDCAFTDNIGNYAFPGVETEWDKVPGGAVSVYHSELTLTGSEFSGNRASLGGALLIDTSDAVVDYCVFRDNLAYPQVQNPDYETGPWSSMGLGGAIYVGIVNPNLVSITNNAICDNRALNGYGGIYAFYNDSYLEALPHGFGIVKLNNCGISGNVCERAYDYSDPDMMLWLSHPGNVWDIPYLDVKNSIIIDETFGSDFPKYQRAAEENGKNYMASPAKAEEDKVTVNVSDITNGAENDREVSVMIILIIAIAVMFFVSFIVLRRREKKTEESAISALIESGETVNDEEDSTDWIDRVLENPEITEKISSREQDVLRLILLGKSRIEIAEELFITESTVKKHSSSIYSKLGVANKVELISRLAGK